MCRSRTPLSKGISYKISNMSLLCACLVVGINCRHSISGYTAIAVPSFFLFSGYFLAAHASERNWWREEVKKRVMTLLVPFMVWALLYQLIFLPCSVFANYVAHRPFASNIALLNGEIFRIFGLDLLHHPYTGLLWYLRALIIYVLISCGLVPLIKRFPIVSLGVAVIGCYYLRFAEGVIGNLNASLNNYSGLMYFMIGIGIRLFDWTIKGKRYVIFAFVVGMMLLLQGNSFFATPFLVYFTWGIMPSCQLPRWLSGVAFPIYLMHSIVQTFWWMVIKKFVPEDSYLADIASWPIAIIVCICLANIIRCLFPNVFKFLFGGRG